MGAAHAQLGSSEEITGRWPQAKRHRFIVASKTNATIYAAYFSAKAGARGAYCRNALPSELRPAPVDRKFGAGREGRIEREEEDGFSDFF